MPNLTVSEKEHWKERITRRIDKRIELLSASEPALLDRIREQARQRALQSLGLAEFQAAVDAIVEQRQELERRERQAHRVMLATVRRVPMEAVEDYFHCSPIEISNAIQRRQSIHRTNCWPRIPLVNRSYVCGRKRRTSWTLSGWRVHRNRSRNSGRRSWTSWVMNRPPWKRKP
jgi:hypothetical protein